MQRNKIYGCIAAGFGKYRWNPNVKPMKTISPLSELPSADSLRERICALQEPRDSHAESRTMNKHQLEHLRETLETIVDELCNREQAVDEEQAHLQEPRAELDFRQTHIRSLEEVLAQHQATETQLATQLTALVASLEERAQSQPQWLATELEKFEARALSQLNTRLTAGVEAVLADKLVPLSQELPDQLAQKLASVILPASAPPSLSELVREMERIQSRAVGALSEQLTASLQTSISVQLAPLSDVLPERLLAAVSAGSAAQSGLPLSMPDLARELEKFESRSMARMAARMTAGLQSAMSSQLTVFSAELPTKIAAAVAGMAATANGAGSSLIASLSTGQAGGDPESAARVKELASELEQVRRALTQSNTLLAEVQNRNSLSSQSNTGSTEVLAKLSESESECQRLSAQLELNQAKLSQAVLTAETHDKTIAQENELVAVLRAEVNELRSLLAAKEHDSLIVQELREELVGLRSAEHSEQAAEGHDPAQDDVLRERLERATCEIIDLRSQNEELAEQVTRLQISTDPHGPMPHLGQEGLSWEERKRLLMQQLDAEQSHDDSPHSQGKRIEINDVLRSTEAELLRRDREIAELRSLLEQQSDAREGMAVGAAAVAQLIESDELVQEEREKLRVIQRSWDEKLRQAEIDISMERAKLAREKLQLEEQKRKLQDALDAVPTAAPLDPKAAADAKGRKWLSRLGLKEDT